jgi:hypothetical protein
LAVLALLAAAFAYADASAWARKPSRPVVVKPKWRLVLRSTYPSDLAVNDRYLAILHLQHQNSQWVTLIDDQTGKQKTLIPPACPRGYGFMFGGPWLMAGCGLYSLSTGRWTPLQVSSQCFGSCGVVAIGRYWMKISTDEGQDTYPLPGFYLQNIASGQFMRDPAIPQGTVFDDLNSPSGSRPLCSRLRYPSFYVRGSLQRPYLGSLTFLGDFALTAGEDVQGNPPYPSLATVYRVHRCGSNLNLVVYNPADYYNAFPDWSSPPVASSRAVIMSANGRVLQGWSLPSLRRFTVQPTNLLKRIEATTGHLQLTALTAHRIYVNVGDRLWAAALPSPQ